MKKEKIRDEKFELRKKAEEALGKQPEEAEDLAFLSLEAKDRLVQELRVHQVELEMQNNDLREAQLELQEARDKYADLYDFAPVGYFTISEKGMIQGANLTGAAMLGMERAKLIGQPFVRFITRDTQDVFYLHRRKLIETKSRQGCEVRLMKEDGPEFYARMESIVVEDGEGHISHFRAAVSNIDEIKKAGEEKRRLEAQLMQAKKMEAIATLAGGIAHEFNNALTLITGHTGLIEMEFPDNGKIMDYVKPMKESGHRMARLTSQLLAYARGGRYNPRPMSLSEFVEDTLPLIRHTLAPAIRVETDLPPDIPSVEADQTQMQMVLSAIMANANEAIEGPGRIRITTKNVEVDPDVIKDYPGLTPGRYVSLSIEDDGKGMDEETRSRIFEPFFTTHFMGRGLGMASVYGIVTNHGGAITVDSEPGKETAVTIYLPAISAGRKEQGAKVVLTPEVELPRGEGTVLVIEDEESLVELFRKILEILGYRVLQARTGEEAVEIVRTFDGQIDLALLDIKLPDMEGGRVYPLIMEVRPDLKVIVCSGYSIDGPAQEILDAGAQAFIQKPFSISTLAEKLREVLEGRLTKGY